MNAASLEFVAGAPATVSMEYSPVAGFSKVISSGWDGAVGGMLAVQCEANKNEPQHPMLNRMQRQFMAMICSYTEK